SRGASPAQAETRRDAAAMRDTKWRRSIGPPLSVWIRAACGRRDKDRAWYRRPTMHYGPLERVVGRHRLPPPPTRRTYAKLATKAMTNGTTNTTSPANEPPGAYSG